MGDLRDTIFPAEFGTSVDDFLQRYESLIFKVIYERTRYERQFDPEDLFHEFFIHIASDNFRRLHSYRGECQPTTYIGKILRNFLCDQYRKKEFKFPIESLDGLEEENRGSEPVVPPDQEERLTEEIILDALQETFSRLSNREKLIFDLFTDDAMTAKEIAILLGVPVKSVYKNNEKIKGMLKGELKKRGMGEY